MFSHRFEMPMNGDWSVVLSCDQFHIVFVVGGSWAVPLCEPKRITEAIKENIFQFFNQTFLLNEYPIFLL